jgi:hypothetical protein
MTQLWCPGQCDIYLGYVTPGTPATSGSAATPATVSNANAAFLGWAEEAPDIEVTELYEPVYTDPGGNQVPTDKSWQREIGHVGILLSKFNRFPFFAATDMPACAAALAGNDVVTNRGLALPGYVGTLMLTEGQAVVVYVKFPYAAKPAFGGGGGPPAGMEQGYRFFGGTLMSFDPGATGTKPQKVGLEYECLGYPFTGTNTAYGNQYFQLYDGNLAGLPPVN